MNFTRLLELVGDEPVFDSAVLLAGPVNPADLRCQLSRWTKAGRLIQLRRGVYTLAPPYQKIKPHPFLIANRLLPASYVSLQSALDYLSPTWRTASPASRLNACAALSLSAAQKT